MGSETARVPISRAISSPSSGNRPAAGQPLQQLRPAVVLLEHAAERPRGLVLVALGRERHAVPEGQLRVLGPRAVGRLVLAPRSLGVAGRGQLVAGLHALVGATHPEQPAELGERLGMVLHADVERPVLRGIAGGAGRHDQDRRRLAPAEVAALGLRRVERGEQPLAEVAAGADE